MIAMLSALLMAGAGFAGLGCGFATMGALERNRHMAGMGAGLAVAGLALLFLTMGVTA